MDSRVVERRIRCPFCGEAMTILVDTSAGGQSYVEDCQICCQPMQISFEAEEDIVLELRVDCGA
jgi:transcription elongation factor Elf1